MSDDDNAIAAEQPDNRGDLVIVASCGDTVESGMLRSFLEDQGVYCYVQGENHRSMLGKVGTYIDIHIMVPSASADLARQLIEDFRSAAEPVLEDDALEDDEDTDEPEFAAMERATPYSDKKLSIAIGLAAGLGLGTGHFYVGAPIRGLILLVAQLAGLAFVGTAPVAAAVLHFGARVVDGFGSASRLADKQRAEQLPRARVVRS